LVYCDNVALFCHRFIMYTPYGFGGVPIPIPTGYQVKSPTAGFTFQRVEDIPLFVGSYGTYFQNGLANPAEPIPRGFKVVQVGLDPETLEWVYGYLPPPPADPVNTYYATGTDAFSNVNVNKWDTSAVPPGLQVVQPVSLDVGPFGAILFQYYNHVENVPVLLTYNPPTAFGSQTYSGLMATIPASHEYHPDFLGMFGAAPGESHYIRYKVTVPPLEQYENPLGVFTAVTPGHRVSGTAPTQSQADMEGYLPPALGLGQYYLRTGGGIDHEFVVTGLGGGSIISPVTPWDWYELAGGGPLAPAVGYWWPTGAAPDVFIPYGKEVTPAAVLAGLYNVLQYQVPFPPPPAGYYVILDANSPTIIPPGYHLEPAGGSPGNPYYALVVPDLPPGPRPAPDDGKYYNPFPTQIDIPMGSMLTPGNILYDTIVVRPPPKIGHYYAPFLYPPNHGLIFPIPHGYELDPAVPFFQELRIVTPPPGVFSAVPVTLVKAAHVQSGSKLQFDMSLQVPQHLQTPSKRGREPGTWFG
jgi:hypothetical protein